MIGKGCTHSYLYIINGQVDGIRHLADGGSEAPRVSRKPEFLGLSAGVQAQLALERAGG